MIRSATIRAAARLARGGPAALLLLVLVISGCGRGAGNGALTASGHVEATEVRIATKVPGQIVLFSVREGDRVSAGQILARIDTVDLALSFATAAARLDQAESDLRLKESGSRREDILEAEAQLAAAEATLAGADRDLARLEALFASGAASAQQRDDLRTRHATLVASRRASRERLDRVRNGFRAEEVAGSRAAAAAARAQVAVLRQQLTDAVVRSPLAGIVTRKLVEPGELVAAGTALCIVTNLEDAWLTAYVPGPELGRIRLGQEAFVGTDDGQTRTGTLIFISPEAEFTPRNVQTKDERVKLVHRIKIGLPNADGLFKPGMPADATLARTGS